MEQATVLIPMPDPLLPAGYGPPAIHSASHDGDSQEVNRGGSSTGATSENRGGGSSGAASENRGVNSTGAWTAGLREGRPGLSGEDQGKHVSGATSENRGVSSTGPWTAGLREGRPGCAAEDGQNAHDPASRAVENRGVNSNGAASENRGENLPGRSAERVLPDGRTMSEYLRTLELESTVSMYEVDLSERLEEPVPVVTLDAMTVCSEGNLSAVVGEAKSKKTFFCSALVGGVLSAAGYMGFDPREVQVLWIDTEQSESHVHRVIRRTHIIACLDCTASDPRLRVLSLRELDPKLRAQVAFDAIELHRPQLVVIDGIGDLQYNTNDLEESEHILTQLMRLSTHYRTHILCVLHTNPNSDKARGHVGSALQRKAETVFYLHRVEHTTLVEPQFCRNEPFERFAFRIDPQGLPELCALPAQTEADVCVKLLRSEYGGAAERTVLTDRIAHTEGCSINLARVRITRALKRGLLRASDDGREVTVA